MPVCVKCGLGRQIDSSGHLLDDVQLSLPGSLRSMFRRAAGPSHGAAPDEADRGRNNNIGLADRSPNFITNSSAQLINNPVVAGTDLADVSRPYTGQRRLQRQIHQPRQIFVRSYSYHNAHLSKAITHLLSTSIASIREKALPEK